jgi:hypothetical protein
MSSESSATATPGTLIVEVPHWAATVRVFDNLLQSAINVSSPVDAGNGLFRVVSTLAPAVYKVDVALGSTSDSEWVSVRPGKETTIPASRWGTLQLASAAPLQSTGSGGPGPNAEAAEEWSRKVTWAAPQSGQARLFIFVRTPDVKAYPTFSDGLTLLDAGGQPLTRLDSGSTFKDPNAGWMAFATDLPGGSYILRRDGPGPVLYNQPLYLCEPWETHVFIVGGKGPSFRALTVNMAPHGDGFRHDDETATASDAVLTALLREHGMRAVLGSTQLSRMLRQEYKNPWLAVLAVYGMMAIEEAAERDFVEQSSVANYDPALKAEVLQFLNQTIGHHPDVRALTLNPDAPAPQPFAFPPMLRIGLRRVQQHATKFADTIPVGSLMDRMLDRLVTSSSWSVWRQPMDVGKAQESEKSASAGMKDRAQRRIASTVLRSGFAASAPIFVAAPAAGTALPASELGRVLHDLPVIKAAHSMLGRKMGSLPEKIVVDSKAELSNLFEQVDPRALSAESGIPLGRAQRSVERLRRTAEAGTSLPGGAGPTARAVVEFALRQASRNERPRGNATEDAASVLGPQPESVPKLTLEECVSKLRSGAMQLLTAESAAQANASDTSDSDSLRAAQVAARLNAIARVLLGSADLIAITDPHAEFLYGNGAFTILMTMTDEKQPVQAGRRWCKWLSSLPLGCSANQTSPLDASGRLWTVQRSAVEYAGTEGTSAYVNILADEQLSRLSADVFEWIAAAVSDVTLHASFVQYGSPRRRSGSLERLETIATGLEQSLLVAPGVANDAGRA